MKINLPIVYSQWDSRWAGDMLGFNTQLPYNMYNFGCLITCYAMILRYYGKDTEPGKLNSQIKDLGKNVGFQGGGNYVWGSVNKIYGDVKENKTSTPSALTNDQIQAIRTSIDNGHPVIIGIDVSPKTVAYDSHFVVIVDYDPNDENNFTIADPLGAKIRSLKDYLGWFKPNARATIEIFCIVTGPKPKINGDTIPVNKDDFVKLVRNSTEWDKTVRYLKPGGNPDITQFEELQTVVAGIKSRQTDLENQLNKAVGDREQLKTEIDNLKDKIANIQADCQKTLQLKQAEYDALKKTVPDVEKLRGQYEGTITKLQGELRESQKGIGALNLRITELETQIEQYTKAEMSAQKVLAALVVWIKSKL